jgi:hypothetical protein
MLAIGLNRSSAASIARTSPIQRFNCAGPLGPRTSITGSESDGTRRGEAEHCASAQASDCDRINERPADSTEGVVADGADMTMERVTRFCGSEKIAADQAGCESVRS